MTDERREIAPYTIRETLAAMVLEHDAGGITMATLREAREHLAVPSPDVPSKNDGARLDWAALGHEYAGKALSGGWPQVTSPQYALAGAFTEMAREIERLRAALLASSPNPPEVVQDEG